MLLIDVSINEPIQSIIIMYVILLLMRLEVVESVPRLLWAVYVDIAAMHSKPRKIIVFHGFRDEKWLEDANKNWD